MSWQAYVDTNLVGTGKIDKAAILGLAGGVWASTADFKTSLAEQTAILKAFADANEIQAGGIHLAGKKYITTTATERTIQGKKGADGVVIVKTKQAVLVTVYIAPNQAGEVTPVVEALADYLIERNY